MVRAEALAEVVLQAQLVQVHQAQVVRAVLVVEEERQGRPVALRQVAAQAQVGPLSMVVWWPKRTSNFVSAKTIDTVRHLA